MVEQETTLLREAGHEVVEYLRESDEIERFSAMRRLELPARVVWSREDARMVTDLARRSRPDIVHIHNTFPLISPSVIRSLGALQIPIVMTLHNPRLFCANAMLFRDGRPCEDCLGSSPLPGLVHACYRDSRIATAPIIASIAVHQRLDTWRRVATFITPSAFLRTKVAQGGLPLDRVVVKPNFVPAPARTRERPGSHHLFLGRLSPEKGPDLLVSAWDARLGRLLVAGEGPLRSKLDRTDVARAGVRFLGHRTAAECSDLLRSSRALVVPSRVYEVFPVAVAEAFAHGVPVIAPAHGPFPDIVEDGVTGLLFAPGDTADLARCLRAVLDDSLSMRLGAQARRVYEALYTPERNLRSLESIYAGVLGREGPFGRVAAPVTAEEAGS
jgi:glycosyltransferase involved in cell wall biosynthesis